MEEELRVIFGIPSADWRGLGKLDIDLGREGTEPKGLGFLHDIFIAVSDVLAALCNTLKKKKLECSPS